MFLHFTHWLLGKGKGTDIPVREGTSPLQEITCDMGSHSVICHAAAVTYPPLPLSKLVLNLATQDGCKTELTYVVVIFLDSLPYT